MLSGCNQLFNKTKTALSLDKAVFFNLIFKVFLTLANSIHPNQ